MFTTCLNKVFLEGVIGAISDITTRKETKVCAFKVRVKERWKNREGDSMEKSNWFNIEVIGKYAERTHKQLKLGMHCLIEGYIKSEKTDTGNNIKVVASGIREVAGDYELDHSINNVVLVGSIDGEVYTKVLSSNTEMSFFNLLFIEKWKTYSGTEATKNNWIKVEMLGNNVSKYHELIAGCGVIIDGFLRYEKYADDREITKIRAFSVQAIQ